MLTIGSACTGIGGLDLGLEWAGLGPVLWQVEPNRYCRRVLARHWPEANRRIRYVQGIPAAIPTRLPRVDLFVAGFPCQDISQANPDGAGLDGERSGLFWWCLDAIDAIQPGVVVFENVGRLLQRGVDVVVDELTQRRFTVECTRLRAADVRAPHQRERVFFVGYAHGFQLEGGGGLWLRGSRPGQGSGSLADRIGVAHPAPERWAERGHPGEGSAGRAEPPRGRHGSGALADPSSIEPERRGGPGVMGGAPTAPHREGLQQERDGRAPGYGGAGLAHAHSGGQEERGQPRGRFPHGDEPVRRDRAEPGALGPGAPGGELAPGAPAPEPGLGRAAHGVPARVGRYPWPAPRGLDPYPGEPPRLVEHFRGRREQLRGIGNAVVPQCGYVVGRRVIDALLARGRDS